MDRSEEPTPAPFKKSLHFQLSTKSISLDNEMHELEQLSALLNERGNL